MYGHKYTDEERMFFEEYVSGHSYREIQQEFIKRFGWEITISQVNAYIGNHKLNTGRTGRFVKGQIPPNKGKKMSPEIYEKCKGTMFKKGNIPPNHRPVGSERTTKDGYIEIKIREPNKWMLKHRYLWEQVHGKIPDKHILIFRDNNKTNITLDNLLLISQSQNAVINHTGLSNTIDEAKDAAANYANLSNLISKKRKVIKRGK